MILIFGKRGSGKTLLSVKFLIEKMLNGLMDTFQLRQKIEVLNGMGYHFSNNYKHLAFANFDVNSQGTKIPNLKINAFNPFRFGFKCKDGYKTYLLPPGSLLAITEAQRVFNSHMAGYFRSEISGAIETSRHWGVDFILDTQRPRLILPSVRELCDMFIQCLEVKELKDNRGFCVGHKWKVRTWENWQDVQSFLDNGKLENFKDEIITCDKCLFQNYDSYFCKYLFLKGRREEDFYKAEFPEIRSIADVEKFEDSFGLNVPDGYWKSKSSSADFYNDEVEIL